jgi:phosphoglycerate dehydrogenase-like enzyme
MQGELLDQLENARVIVRNGVGFDNVDVEAAHRLGIPVCHVPDYGTEEVADHALMLTLCLERKLVSFFREVGQGGWSWHAGGEIRRLRGLRFGIVGCGRIGTATALRAKAFGYSVQFFDPYVSNGYEKALGVDRVRTLHHLLSSSDVISIHAPLTSETAGMLDSGAFSIVKPGALLINTARGPIVNEGALIQALRDGILGGVGLDVVEREPRFNPDLLRFPNCLITPHCAFYSSTALLEMRTTSCQIVSNVLDGKLPINVVNGVGASGPRPRNSVPLRSDRVQEGNLQLRKIL